MWKIWILTHFLKKIIQIRIFKNIRSKFNSKENSYINQKFVTKILMLFNLVDPFMYRWRNLVNI